MAKPFGLMLEALDDLKPNEIYVNTGSSPRNALWGELMSIRAARLGAAGAVLNGYLRDTKAILSLNFPAFSWGSYAQDSAPRYKVVDFRIAVEIATIRIRPGDFLFGDIDGVCVVPTEAATEVFTKALEKARGEKLVRKALEEGSSAVEASRSTASCEYRANYSVSGSTLTELAHRRETDGQMISIDLSGKVILITGALGAIAEHMVKKLNAAGATLVLLDLQTSGVASETLRKWGLPEECYVYHSLDLADSETLTRVVDDTFERFPAMDTVLGHAGGCGLHPFSTTSEAEFERIFRFNFLSQVSLTRAVFAQWIERSTAGHLVFTSSYVARVPHTQIPAYASAKAALENFARCMALEYATSGIRVNVISPGNVAAGSSLKVFDEDPAYREFVLRVSLGKRNSPESIADAFVFLCSPLASEISGQILSSDYGSGIGNRL